MNKEIPGEMPNPFEGVEEMEVEIPDDSRVPKKRKTLQERILEQDEEEFEKNLRKERSVKKDNGLEIGKTMDIGRNTPKGAMEPKDKKGGPVAS